MRKILKSNLKKVINSLGLTITKTSTMKKLESNAKYGERIGNYLKFLADIKENIDPDILNACKSQLGQDLFVLATLMYKKNGFFVEFGATDGKDISNTYILEKKFGWNGVLAEPAFVWHKSLENNRECSIVKKCVWTESGKYLRFKETEGGELSGIESAFKKDMHYFDRGKGKIYEVETITLTDMLEECGAPSQIDYLSIDTEGSEYEILKSHDFEKYSFKIITCEHNFLENRVKVNALLTSKGYSRVHLESSQFDDWYIKKSDE